tara:strand:+ start:2410 stop:4380 length:1971 start_codon:yes stop_codon:yes gene_type:complete
MAYKFQLGTAILSGSVVASDDDSFDLGSSTKEYKDLYLDGTANVDALNINGTAVTSTATELNLLDAVARGSIVYGNASGASALLSKGAANTVLVSDGTDISYSTIANANIDASAAIVDTKLATISTANKVSLSAIDLDGATDIGANLVDADLIFVDDGAGGTNRKSTVGRIPVYLNDHASLTSLNAVTSATALASVGALGAGSISSGFGAIDIGASSLDAGVINGTQISASVGFSGSMVQATMANFGAGGVSTQGNIESADVSGSGDLLMGGTVRFDGVATAGISRAADFFYFLDASDNLMKKRQVGEVVGVLAGAGLDEVSDQFAVQVDNSSVEVNGSNQLQVKATGITNAMLAGSIANGKLSNSSVSYGGVSLSLGQSDATPAFDLSDATAYPGDSSLVTAGVLNAGSINTGFGSINNGASAISTTGTGSFGKVIISGDLIVQGTETILDVTTLGLTGSIRFEGATADAHETTLGVIDPTADRQIDLPNAAGNLAVFSHASFQTAASAITLTELELLDGGTARGTTAVATGDGFLHNDNGTMRMTNVSSLATYVGENLAEKIKTATGTYNVDFADGHVIIADASSGNVILNLPALASGNDGKILKIKKIGSNSVTINRSGVGQDIDGLASIVLDSDHAAISLIFDDTNNKYHVL